MSDTCNTLENLFLDHAMLIRNDVVKSIQDSDFYIKRLPKEPWLDGQGYQYSYPIYERSIVTKAITDPDFFQSFATLDNTVATDRNLQTTGACNVTGWSIDSFGITTRTVTLKKSAVNSPDICLDDLKFQWQVLDQIKNVTRVLSENSKFVWSLTYQDEYRNACGNFVTAGYNDIDTNGFDPLEPPTATLSFGLLNTIHEQLGFNGGTINPTAKMDDGTAVYDAVGSLYTFNDLKSKSANERNDFRYFSAGGGADQGILTERIGLGSKIYQGYRFNAVQFPPRWSLGNGQYVRQYPYSSTNATRGKKWDVGSNYKNAPYEDTAIYHDEVLRVLIPKPGINAGGGLSYLYGAYSWAGEFVWRNIPDRDCNIDGNIGFFRALFAYGIKVERPDLGFVIRHLRCDRAQDLTDCYGNAVTSTST
jgi:hypothetical protein